MTGRSVPTGEEAAGRALVVENYDPLAALAHRKDGELTLRSWLASVRRSDEAAWFARDDLAPFFVAGVRTVWEAVERRVRG